MKSQESELSKNHYAKIGQKKSAGWQPKYFK